MDKIKVSFTQCDPSIRSFTTEVEVLPRVGDFVWLDGVKRSVGYDQVGRPGGATSAIYVVKAVVHHIHGPESAECDIVTVVVERSELPESLLYAFEKHC